MCNSVTQIKKNLLDAVKVAYPDLHIRMEEDPEDDTIVRVRVYGVDDSDYMTVHKTIQNIIKEFCSYHPPEFDFVPSVIRKTDTLNLFPSFAVGYV